MAADSPFLDRLLSLLEKPNSVDIAERMVKSRANNKRIVSMKPIVNMTCPCAMLRWYWQTPLCKEFHWNCILHYLTLLTIKIHNNEPILCPRFSLLSKTAQINFLTLLTRTQSSIPECDLHQFIDKIKDYIEEDNWTGYLLRRLLLPPDQNNYCQTSSRLWFAGSFANKTEVQTALSLKTLQHITDICSTNGSQSSVQIRPISLNVFGGSLTLTNRKNRKREFEEEQGGSEEKRIKREMSEEPSSNNKVSSAIELAQPIDNQSLQDIIEVSETVKSVMIAVKEAWNKGQAAKLTDFLAISSLPSKQFQYCLSQLTHEDSPDICTDTRLIAIIHNITQSDLDLSYHYQTLCLQELLSPHLIALKRPVSRVLLSNLKTLLKKYPIATVDNWLYPQLLSPLFNISHSDMICKLLKDTLTDDQRNYLWKKLICTHENLESEPYIWNEQVLSVLQQIIDKAVNMESFTIINLVQSLQQNAGYHVTTLKFAKLLHTLLTKHNLQLVDYMHLLTDVIESNKTVFKTRLLSLI